MKKYLGSRNFLLGILAVAVLFVALVVFGPTREEKSVTYTSPIWSPDGKRVAYMKRFMDYTYVDPIIDLPFSWLKRGYQFKTDRLALAVNDPSAKAEKVIKTINLSREKRESTDKGMIKVKLAWYKEPYKIKYNVITAGFKNDLDTGNMLINPDGTGDYFFADSFDSSALILTSFPTMASKKELSVEANFGEAIFVFDHNTKKVSLLVASVPPSKVELPNYRPPGPEVISTK